MDTYFVRHNTGMDIDATTRCLLWEEQRIAIHFPHQKDGTLGPEDQTSLDPEDYEGQGRKCLRTLVELAKSGGYVCAQHYPHEECLLGLIEPNSNIELLKGRWGDQNDLAARTAILKTIKLKKCKVVNPLDYAVLAVGRPRQGTIARWLLARETVENLVENRQSMPELSDLTPRQQEILCSEFLRLPEAASFGLPQMAHLLLPPGHTMKDIDIIGIATDGKRLLAQVTFLALSGVALKLDRLLPYRSSGDSHLILFCDCEHSDIQQNITVFPISKAYNSFVASKLGPIWLRYSA